MINKRTPRWLWWWRGFGGDDGGDIRRVKESDGGDRIDPGTRSLFGLRRKIFSDGGWWWSPTVGGWLDILGEKRESDGVSVKTEKLSGMSFYIKLLLSLSREYVI
ncbi:hypothetical protein Tco_0341344 [Tanacetum coccineum]